MRNLTDFAGDIEFNRITHGLLCEFADSLRDRADAGLIGYSTASVEASNLKSVLDDVLAAGVSTAKFSTEGLKIRRGERIRRPSFSTSWIQEKILDPLTLSALDPVARALLHSLINTGLRISEATGLSGEMIRLDSTIPRLVVTHTSRRLKTKNAAREIPLAGISLAAFQAFPRGFQKLDRGAYASNLLDRYLKENGLKQSPKHSLHFLRHSFCDRLVEAGATTETIAALTGHSLPKGYYGQGGGIEHKYRLVLASALYMSVFFNSTYYTNLSS